MKEDQMKTETDELASADQFEKDAFPHMWEVTVMAREHGAIGVFEPMTFERRERFDREFTHDYAIELANWRGLSVNYVISIRKIEP